MRCTYGQYCPYMYVTNLEINFIRLSVGCTRTHSVLCALRSDILSNTPNSVSVMRWKHLMSVFFSFYNFVDVVGGRRNINNARLRCSCWMCAGCFYAIALEVSICIYIIYIYIDARLFLFIVVVLIMMMVVILKRVECSSWFFPLFLYVCVFIIGSLWCCRRTFWLRLIIFSVYFSASLFYSFPRTLIWFGCVFLSECVRDRKPRNGLITTREMCLLTTNMGSHAFYSVQSLSL